MMMQEQDVSQSFVVNIRSTENHTWHGTVTWVEGKKQLNFRSTLELLKLMDSAVEMQDEEQSFTSGENV